MKGRRLPDGPLNFAEFEPGCYQRDQDGKWWIRAPKGGISGPTNHTVTEHEDGTITLSPSVLIYLPAGAQWHGYLERGEWREA